MNDNLMRDAPIPTGELIGKEITLDCVEQDNDFYFIQTPVRLTTEYDLTKGIDVTFDGKRYKNVPVHHIKLDEGDAILIGEFNVQQPILSTYPFFIRLVTFVDQ